MWEEGARVGSNCALSRYDSNGCLYSSGYIYGRGRLKTRSFRHSRGFGVHDSRTFFFLDLQVDRSGFAAIRGFDAEVYGI